MSSDVQDWATRGQPTGARVGCGSEASGAFAPKHLREDMTMTDSERLGRSVLSDIRMGVIAWLVVTILDASVRNNTLLESVIVGLIVACLVVLVTRRWETWNSEESSVLTIRGEGPAVPILPDPKRRRKNAREFLDQVEDDTLFFGNERPDVQLEGADKIQFERQIRDALAGVNHYERMRTSFERGSDVRNARLRPIKVRMEGWGYWAPDLYVSSWDEWARFLGNLLGHVQARTLDRMPTPRDRAALSAIRAKTESRERSAPKHR